MASRYGIRLCEFSQLLLAAEVFQRSISDDKVRGKHAGCDFAAVSTVADERIDKIIALRWLD